MATRRIQPLVLLAAFRPLATLPARAPAAAVAPAALGSALLYAVALAGFEWLPLYDCVILPLLLAVLFPALDRLGRRPRAWTLAGVSSVLAAAFLLRLWTLGYEGRNAVLGGILPWSDSADFYSDALRLLHGERFSPASSRRPLFVALLAGLLKLSGGDLRASLAILAALGAATMILPALEVWRTDGWKAALAVYLLFVFFERRWTGFIQTEHLGLPLGAAGFALAWRAQSLRQIDPRGALAAAAAAVFAISLGLFARAGCFFVLPALVIWGAALAPVSRRKRAAALLAAAGTAAFCVHEAVLRAAGNGITFSDYPPIFYGLLHGQDFTYIAQTHRWIEDLAPPDRPSAEWGIVFAEIRLAPWILPLALARSLLAFFVSPFGVFSYVWTNPDDAIFEDGARVNELWRSGGPAAILRYWQGSLGTFSIVNAAAMGALGASLVVAFAVALIRIARRRRDPASSLLFAASAGIVASVPFMPAWITSGVQVQTVTLGFAAALPASLLSARGPPGAEPAVYPRAIARSVPIGVAILAALLAWVLLSPELPPSRAAAPDRAGRSSAALHWVDLAPDGTVEVAARRTLSLRRKGLADLAASMALLSNHNADLTDSVAPSMNVGTLFHSAYDPAEGHWEILVDGARRLDATGGGWVAVRSTPLRSPRVQTLLEAPPLRGEPRP